MQEHHTNLILFNFNFFSTSFLLWCMYVYVCVSWIAQPTWVDGSGGHAEVAALLIYLIDCLKKKLLLPLLLRTQLGKPAPVTTTTTTTTTHASSARSLAHSQLDLFCSLCSVLTISVQSVRRGFFALDWIGNDRQTDSPT